MKQLINLIFGLGGFVLSVSAQSIIVANPAPFARINEVVAIERNFFGKAKMGLYPVVKEKNKILVSQVIDENNDDVWDELLIEIDLGPHIKDTLEISWVAKEQQRRFKKITNVQLSLRSDTDTPSPEINHAVRIRDFSQNIAKPFYQMEGPGIENDKVAFRVFFDSRNSKDIYGKTVDTPVLERVGVGAGWHTLQPWGMDIFHTGNSLGAGGLAVEENKKIFRLGDADTSNFMVLYEGALKAAFGLDFKNWDVATGKKSGSETISLTKGDFYYKNVIRVGLNKNQHLIAGIANFGIDKIGYKKHNAVFSSVSTYGKQVEGTDTKLGVAILFSSDQYINHLTTDTASIIPSTTYVTLKPSADGKQVIYFFACWEKTDKRFETQQGFDNYLQQAAESLAYPVQIKMIVKK